MAYVNVMRSERSALIKGIELFNSLKSIVSIQSLEVAVSTGHTEVLKVEMVMIILIFFKTKTAMIDCKPSVP